MFYTALILGFLGSLHCVGMCGPLTLMIPTTGDGRWKFILGRSLYNVGRVLMYGFLGLFVGFFGEQLSFFSSQKTFSIILGAVILLVLLLPQKWQDKLSIYTSMARLASWVKSSLSSLYKKHTYFAQFFFGLVNGLLPCGLVYAALAGAFLSSEIWQGGVYMLLFGVGTLPMMLSLSFGSAWIKKIFGNKISKVIPVTYGIIAIWLILRGFNVNVPSLYTAPDVENIPDCHTTIPAKK